MILEVFSIARNLITRARSWKLKLEEFVLSWYAVLFLFFFKQWHINHQNSFPEDVDFIIFMDL